MLVEYPKRVNDNTNCAMDESVNKEKNNVKKARYDTVESRRQRCLATVWETLVRNEQEQNGFDKAG